MGLRLRTAPTIEPVSLSELKEQVRVTYDDEDQLLTSLIRGARQWVENYCSRPILTQTWDYYATRFPSGACPIIIHRAPFQSVSTFVYDDTTSTQQTLTSVDYQIAMDEPIRVYPALGEVWPDTDGSIDNINFRFVAGWTTAALVPQPIKDAILMHAALRYKEREGAQENLDAVKTMLSDYVLRAYP